MRKVWLSTSFLAAFLFIGSAAAIDRMVDGFPDLPKDAREVAERSLACQHFGGEVSGTGDERDKEVARQLKQLRCNRVAHDLDQIRAKYRKNTRVLKVIQEAALE